MKFPSKIVENAVNQLSSLPGIGKKSALRLVLHMIKQDTSNINNFGLSFVDLSKNINYCKECYSISDHDICSICSNHKRDQNTICVVEDIRVLMSIEKTMQYNGKYHVIGGLISPIDGISPEKLRINELVERIKKTNISEVIFALSTTMNGDTTNFYIYNKIKDMQIKISSIARGISIGDELEYTDEMTLGTAITSRLPYENSFIK
ncbi:MAG: recombination protein RecR [Flavobacteriales bacterium]|nr:recombination protein RecR [Flavobacteriales bacterium]